LYESGKDGTKKDVRTQKSEGELINVDMYGEEKEPLDRAQDGGRQKNYGTDERTRGGASAMGGALIALRRRRK